MSAETLTGAPAPPGSIPGVSGCLTGVGGDSTLLGDGVRRFLGGGDVRGLRVRGGFSDARRSVLGDGGYKLTTSFLEKSSKCFVCKITSHLRQNGTSVGKQSSVEPGATCDVELLGESEWTA